jgi:hypothetical protein
VLPENRREIMTSKLKLVLIATIAAVTLASPALAQTATDNGWAATHQDGSFRSGSNGNYSDQANQGGSDY